MKIRDTKIGNQLVLTFIVIYLFVSAIGLISIVDSNQIQNNVETLYLHPLQVRRALSRIEIAIGDMQIHQRNLNDSLGLTNTQESLDQMEIANLLILDNLGVLDSLYLGPQSDVVLIKQNYTLWKNLYDEDTQLILNGEKDTYIDNITVNGKTNLKLNDVYSAVKIVDDFALAKSESLYQNSIKTSNNLNTQLVMVLGLIFVLLGFIAYYLTRNINKPLKSINDAVERFHNGEMSSRIDYQKHNEFGVITDSINLMADKVQLSSILSDRINQLSKIMLSEEEPDLFFKKTLSQLMIDTGAQIGAVYVFNPTNGLFDHLLSIGGTQELKSSFSSNDFEGELGQAFASRKINVVKDISKNTHYAYKTSSGNFVPNEIMTIPVFAKQELVAVISLATLTDFDELALQYIERISTPMGSRIEGVLATREIKRIKETLENTNIILQENKNELSAQTLELIQQNAELELQKNQLNEVSKLKTSFLSNMSHELRTPLNSVIALSGILNRRLENKVSAEEVEYLEIIERNGKNLLALINDILDISRIESGREEIDLSSFNIVNTVQETVALIKPQAVIKNVDLICSAEDKELRIHSDYKKIQHILQNIIGNAVKFTEHGSVTVTCKTRLDRIEVTVSDTGIGISESNIHHIFDEFRQADGSTSRRYGGTGLGLAIAKKYAQLLKGSIEVVSELNVGSSFTLSLPILFDAAASTHSLDVVHIQHETQDIKTIKNLNSKTILLVDDNETALIQIRDLLSETGIHVLTASNAQDAFSIIDKNMPDAMVLDLMMPDIDGFKMLEILRNAPHTAHIPVLILSAKHLTKEDLKFLKRNNVHELILKGSIQRESLQNAIGSMLNTKQAKKKPNMIRQDKEKPLVLVVEDNLDNMITVKALLTDQYRIIEAFNGQEAIDKAKNNLPDLILMDIALPDINGIDAYKKIRTLKALDNTPVIALTASAMEHDRESILLHGFDAFIAKPINSKEFFTVIEEVLYGG
jgi:signal transduction histidine kinase/CheY-like chemotaxis protein/HAMP domain-containing protein